MRRERWFEALHVPSDRDTGALRPSFYANSRALSSWSARLKELVDQPTDGISSEVGSNYHRAVLRYIEFVISFHSGSLAGDRENGRDAARNPIDHALAIDPLGTAEHYFAALRAERVKSDQTPRSVLYHHFFPCLDEANIIKCCPNPRAISPHLGMPNTPETEVFYRWCITLSAQVEAGEFGKGAGTNYRRAVSRFIEFAYKTYREEIEPEEDLSSVKASQLFQKFILGDARQLLDSYLQTIEEEKSHQMYLSVKSALARFRGFLAAEYKLEAGEGSSVRFNLPGDNGNLPRCTVDDSGPPYALANGNGAPQKGSPQKDEDAPMGPVIAAAPKDGPSQPRNENKISRPVPQDEVKRGAQVNPSPSGNRKAHGKGLSPETVAEEYEAKLVASIAEENQVPEEVVRRAELHELSKDLSSIGRPGGSRMIVPPQVRQILKNYMELVRFSSELSIRWDAACAVRPLFIFGEEEDII